MSNPSLPISQKNLNRIMVLLIVILALAAGFFQTVAELEKRKAQKILTEFQDINRNSDTNNPAQ